MPGLVIPHGRWKTACAGATRATTAPAKSTADPGFDGNDNREVGVGSGDPPCGWRAWGGGADPPLGVFFKIYVEPWADPEKAARGSAVPVRPTQTINDGCKS